MFAALDGGYKFVGIAGLVYYALDWRERYNGFSGRSYVCQRVEDVRERFALCFARFIRHVDLSPKEEMRFQKTVSSQVRSAPAFRAPQRYQLASLSHKDFRARRTPGVR